MKYAMGIDEGSSFAKAAVIEEGRLLSSAFMPTAGSFANAARKVSTSALEKAGLSDSDISATVATGYGSSAVDSAVRTTRGPLAADT